MNTVKNLKNFKSKNLLSKTLEDQVPMNSRNQSTEQLLKTQILDRLLNDLPYVKKEKFSIKLVLVSTL